jgi:hypothetical protein
MVPSPTSTVEPPTCTATVRPPRRSAHADALVDLPREPPVARQAIGQAPGQSGGARAGGRVFLDAEGRSEHADVEPAPGCGLAGEQIEVRRPRPGEIRRPRRALEHRAIDHLGRGQMHERERNADAREPRIEHVPLRQRDGGGRRRARRTRRRLLDLSFAGQTRVRHAPVQADLNGNRPHAFF